MTAESRTHTPGGRALFLKYFRWIAGAIALVVLVLGYILLIDAKIREVRDVGLNAVKQKQQLYDERSAYVEKVHGMLTRYADQVTVEDRILLDRALPTALDYPDLLVILNDLAQKNGTQVENISISQGGTQVAQSSAPDDVAAAIQELKGKTADTGTSVTASKAKTSALAQVTINLTLSGSTAYDSVKAFLKGIESSLQIFNVQSLQFTVGSGSGEGGPSTPAAGGQYSLTLTTPYYLSSASVPK